MLHTIRDPGIFNQKSNFSKTFFGLFSKNLPAAQKFWSKRRLYNDSYNLIIFHELKGYSRKMKIKFVNVMESNENSPFKKKFKTLLS